MCLIQFLLYARHCPCYSFLNVRSGISLKLSQEGQGWRWSGWGCIGKNRKHIGLHEDQLELEKSWTGVTPFFSFWLSLFILPFFPTGFLGTLLILIIGDIGMLRLYDLSSLASMVNRHFMCLFPA